MNIQPLNYNFTRKHRLKPGYEHVNPKSEQNSAGVCGEIKNNNVAFSGGLNTSEAAANTLMGKILKSGSFNFLTKFSGAHNIASSALVAFFLAGLLRPAATVALPGKKDKDDKIYAAGHSMASAIMGFIFSTIVTSPLDSGSQFMLKDGMKIRKSQFDKMSDADRRWYMSKELQMSDEDIAKCFKENNVEKVLVRKFDDGIKIITSKRDKLIELRFELEKTADAAKRRVIRETMNDLENHIKAIDTTMRNVVDWGIAIPRAVLTIALIPPILKYVFRLEKKSKSNSQPQPIVAVQASPDKAACLKRVSMHDFMGGVK